MSEDIPPHIQREGVRRSSETVPEDCPGLLDWLQSWCEREERVLRLQAESDETAFELTERDEAALAEPKRSPETLTGAFRRFGYLKHLWHVRNETGGRRHGPPTGGREGASEEAEEAARKLIQREPVEVTLGGRRVLVTGRSYACMVALAKHETRIDELNAQVKRAGELREALKKRLQDGARENGSALRLRRRFEKLGRAQRMMLQEITLHRRALYAHATTEDGAPADGLEDAPEWWREMGPAQDAVLLMALYEAGPARIKRLGPPPEENGEGGRKHDDWGFKSLLMSLERKQGVEPASYFQVDVGKIVAWVRGGAPPVPDELER